MDFLYESFRSAFALILALDQDVVDAVRTSLGVAIWSVIFAALGGVPFGVAVGVNDFPGKRSAITNHFKPKTTIKPTPEELL